MRLLVEKRVLIPGVIFLWQVTKDGNFLRAVETATSRSLPVHES